MPIPGDTAPKPLKVPTQRRVNKALENPEDTRAYRRAHIKLLDEISMWLGCLLGFATVVVGLLGYLAYKVT